MPLVHIQNTTFHKHLASMWTDGADKFSIMHSFLHILCKEHTMQLNHLPCEVQLLS